MPTNLTDTTIAVNGLGRAVDGIALYQNPIDIADGHEDVSNLGIPGINPRALSIGGSGLLGDWITGTNGNLSQAGLLSIAQFNNLTINSSFTAFLNRTTASAIWYVAGDFTLNSGQTITVPERNSEKFSLLGLNEQIATDVGGGLQANGGGHPLGGNGGVDDSGSAYSLTDTTGRDTWRLWNLMPIPGTRGSGNNDASPSTGGLGGGALTILVDGQVTVNGDIVARGGTGTGTTGGYGGAGSVCIASLTGIAGTGTIDCGSSWQSGAGKGGGGGGGYISLIAPDFTGDSITKNTLAGPDGATNGYENIRILNEAQIRSIVASQGLNAYNARCLSPFAT